MSGDRPYGQSGFTDSTGSRNGSLFDPFHPIGDDEPVYEDAGRMNVIGIELAGFDPRPYGLVVTGEVRVDLTTAEGKAPAEVVLRCGVAGVPCVVFGGIVEELVPGAETIALSGNTARAARDLFDLGLSLGTRLLDAAG